MASTGWTGGMMRVKDELDNSEVVGNGRAWAMQTMVF